MGRKIEDGLFDGQETVFAVTERLVAASAPSVDSKISEHGKRQNDVEVREPDSVQRRLLAGGRVYIPKHLFGSYASQSVCTSTTVPRSRRRTLSIRRASSATIAPHTPVKSAREQGFSTEFQFDGTPKSLSLCFKTPTSDAKNTNHTRKTLFFSSPSPTATTPNSSIGKEATRVADANAFDFSGSDTEDSGSSSSNQLAISVI